MSRRIRRTGQVRDDIIQIYRHIRRKSQKGADLVFDAIERSIKALGEMPGVGRLWESPDPRLEGMRITTVTPYRNYLIFFRPTREAVEVFRVVHGAEELERLIDEIDFDFESY